MTRKRPARKHAVPRAILDADKKTGLILGGMGGPDGPDSVAPFLRNLFADPAVLPLPTPLSRVIGSWLVFRRAKEVRDRYLSLGYGGASPQLEWTRKQGERLAELARDRGLPFEAEPAMRYWHPFPEQAVRALWERGARQYLVLPMYPQYAEATTGTVLRKVLRALSELAPDAAVHVIPEWHDLPGYLAALSGRAEPALRSWAGQGVAPEQCALLFVAHSLPQRFIRQGDPYLSQTRATVAGVHEHLSSRLADIGSWWHGVMGAARPLLAFQSQVGPIRWIGPFVLEETRRLVVRGCRRLLVIPVSFTCEHIETLQELDQWLAGEARGLGVEDFVRGEALNLDAGWLKSLADHLVTVAFEGGEAPAVEERERAHA
jgi:ferrochelatase